MKPSAGPSGGRKPAQQMESLKDAGSVELFSPTPKCNAKEEQHFPTKPTPLMLSSFFLVFSLQPLGKSQKLLPLFPPPTTTFSALLGCRCRKGVLSLPTSGTEWSCWLWLQSHPLALLSTSQTFLSPSLCSRPFTKEKVGTPPHTRSLGPRPACPHIHSRLNNNDANSNYNSKGISTRSLQGMGWLFQMSLESNSLLIKTAIVTWIVNSQCLERGGPKHNGWRMAKVE